MKRNHFEYVSDIWKETQQWETKLFQQFSTTGLGIETDLQSDMEIVSTHASYELLGVHLYE